MPLPTSELRIETMRGTGPGGQHRNKTDSACRITHLPTGITAYADERSQFSSRRKAMEELERRIAERKTNRVAAERKLTRDTKVGTPATAIRTYHFPRDSVKDHRTGRSAPIADILEKGRLEMLWPQG